ncbi:MAG: hypothetical protein ACFFCS_16810 [Candidatus Hodarchaeota archaeon]
MNPVTRNNVMNEEKTEQVKKSLKKIKEFKDINGWKLEKISIGATSEAKYKVSRQERSYFFKEIKSNEAEILRILTQLGSELIPKVIFPDMLKKNILVSDYIEPSPVKTKTIELGLIKKFLKMQNQLNDKGFLKENKNLRRYKFKEKDNGNLVKWIQRIVSIGNANLQLLKKYQLKILDDFIEITKELQEHSDEIARGYAQMPFARQHHDFREENIIGIPQKIVDWGSSYGHGPFLFDLAPFLLGDAERIKILVENSDICKDRDDDQINGWLEIATCARFFAFLAYRLDGENIEVSTRKSCNALLEYEILKYKGLEELF